ncbi:hypothetical protein [Alteribacillus sp. HJP-4]|uniref:hypothetical protein n=1 Tax=Alteribacillus sp. HJP-4 TaxID=2775394 RepID=UPI0035CD3307
MADIQVELIKGGLMEVANVDRVRKTYSEDEMERVVDDFITMGYEVLSRGEASIRIRKHGGWGSLGGHALWFLLTVWWTFGIGNIVYALIKRYTGEKVLIKLESRKNENQN